MCEAADPSEVCPLPNDSIMGLSPSSPSVAWYGVGLGRATVSLSAHTSPHTHTHIHKFGVFMALACVLQQIERAQARDLC